MGAVNSMNAPIIPGTRLKIIKGCRARDLHKGITIQIESVQEMGAEYSHSVKVTFRPVDGYHAGALFVFWARHRNRLLDGIIRLNDGNPLNVIEIQRV